MVKIYQNPNPPIIPNIDNLNYVQQTDGNPDTTQFGSESSNIVEIDELKELKVWFEDCIKDYFDNGRPSSFEKYETSLTLKAQP